MVMKRHEFEILTDKNADVIAQIKKSAHELHASVNQTYGEGYPYGFHLDMVADSVYKYGYAVCDDEKDVVPLFFGAFYHDSIEDARLTHNDVKHIARQWMDDSQTLMAAEIVYALTNEKGRTRAERANDKYYQGIRETAYAPFLKLADRLANITYSFTHANEDNIHMKLVYQKELSHFLDAIKSEQTDKRYTLPEEMISAIKAVVNGNRKE